MVLYFQVVVVLLRRHIGQNQDAEKHLEKQKRDDERARPHSLAQFLDQDWAEPIVHRFAIRE
jgi:hypothetical protein